MIRRDLKNMKKRRAAICFLMVFIMSFTLLPSGVFAAQNDSLKAKQQLAEQSRKFDEDKEKQEEETKASETSAKDASKNTAKQDADALRMPELSEEAPSDIDGTVIKRDENSTTYQTSANTYVTRFSSEPLLYTDEKGREKEIDNTLKKSWGSYVNKENAYEIKLPKNGKEVTIDQEDYQIRLKPLFASLKDGAVQDNAIRYNDAAEGIDLQYTAFSSYIKEDIILMQPTELTSFDYELTAENPDGKELEYRVEENSLIAYEKVKEGKKTREVAFCQIDAPEMYDAAGEVSCGISMKLTEKDGKQNLSIQPDQQWLSAPERVYPVTIDPTATINLSKSNMEWHLVENGRGTKKFAAGPNVNHRKVTYLYAGYENGSLIGSTDGAYYGMTRSFIKIKYDFQNLAKNLDLPEDAIVSADFRIYKFRGSPKAGTKVYCKMVHDGWKGETDYTWNNKPVSYSIIAEPQDVSANEWKTFDITTAVRQWMDGSANMGLVLAPVREDQDAVCFSGPGNPTTKLPLYMDIKWTVPNAVDENYPLEEPKISLRPLTDQEDGVQMFTGLLADGIMRPQLTCSWALRESEKTEDIYAGKFPVTDWGKRYPDTKKMETDEEISYRLGYTGIHESNWQTKGIPASKFELTTPYRIYAKGAGASGSTPEGVSDEFIIYEFDKKDTYPYVANYYGVSLSQIVADNRPADYLGTAGSSIFIRNPKQNKNSAYSRAADLDPSHADDIIYANLGRGLCSDFDLEPVNTSTGNFMFEQTDAENMDYTESFTLDRTYNSVGDKSRGLFGYGWSGAFEESLAKDGEDFLYYTGDGRRLRFEKDEGGYSCELAPELSLSAISAKDPQDKKYVIEDEDSKEKRGFNAYGLLSSITDEKNLSTKLSYTDDMKLKEITTPSGKVYQITASDDGQISQIVTPAGYALKYTYKDNLLTSFTNEDGDTIRYEYDKEGHMTSWRDGNNVRQITNTYDEYGRVVKQVDAKGGVSKLSYDKSKTRIEDADGNDRTYTFDERMRTESRKTSEGSDKRVYNDRNDLVKETDAAGNTVKYEYDEAGNLIKETDAGGNVSTGAYDDERNLIEDTDGEGNATKYDYDKQGNIVCETFADGSCVRYTYDVYGRETSSVNEEGEKTQTTYDGTASKTFTDENGNSTVTYYDAMGREVSTVNAEGVEEKTIYSPAGKKTGIWTTGGFSEQYAYDKAGNCIRITDGEGNVSRLTYDGMNNILSITDGNGDKVSYQYDYNGNEVSETNAEGITVTKAYDSEGNKISETDGEGNITRYEYDGIGRLTKETDPIGGETTYEYDGRSENLVKQTGADGTSTFTYDANGNVLTETDGNGAVTENKYDVRGRLIGVTESTGLLRALKYDKAGNLLAEMDSNGRKASYTYDKAGNLLSKTDAAGAVKSYTYDKAGRKISETDEEGGTTSFTYDGKGNITTKTDAEGGVVSYTYNKNGDIASETDENGNTTKYEYDGIGQLVKTTDAAGNTSLSAYDSAERLIKETDRRGYSVHYTYDKADNLIRQVDEEKGVYKEKFDAAGNAVVSESPDGGKVESKYDSYGRLTEEKDAEGLVKTYEYDKAGNLTKQKDNAGNESRFTYDKQGNLIKEKDAAARTASYSYDAYGNLTQEVSFDQDQVSYEYDVKDQMIQMTENDGSKTTYTYDKTGRLTSENLPKDRTYKYTYDLRGNTTGETDPEGSHKAYLYDKAGNLTEETGADGSKYTYIYDALNQVSSETDEEGGVTRYTYDAEGNTLTETDPEGGVTEYLYNGRGDEVKVKDARGAVTENQYDKAGNLTATIHPRGGIERFAYDTQGNTISETTVSGAETTYTYSLDGKLLTETKDNGYKTEYLYDKAGRIRKMNTSEGAERTWSYDAFGNVEKEKEESGNVNTYSYDKGHRVLTEENGKGAVTRFSYDEAGNNTEIQYPTGGKIKYTYDKAGKVTSEKESSLAEINYGYDAAGNLAEKQQKEKTSKYTYDKTGRLLTETTAKGNTTSYEYDKNGNIISVIDPLKRKTGYRYDAEGNLIEEIDAKGNSAKSAYDEEGNQTAAENRMGEEMRYTYDKAGNLTSAKDAEGRSVTYRYNKLDQLTDKIEGGDQQTKYEYDKAGNLTKETSPEGKTTRFTYDAAGNLTAKVNPDKTKITYDYDVLGSLLKKEYSDGSKSVVYGYDASGNRIEMDDESGKSHTTYDELGRVKSYTDGNGQKLTYSYDEYDRIEKITYPKGREVTYGYDTEDNITRVSDNKGITAEFTVDAAGNILSCKRSDGTESAYTYDANDNLIELKNTSKGAEVSTYAYEYDKEDRITKETAQQEGKKTITTFTYDKAGQLSGYTKNTDGTLRTTTYTYNAAGSRMSVTKGGNEGTITVTYNKDNQVIAEKNSKTGDKIKYVYDDNGNLIEKKTKGKSTVYNYDTENRLRSVTKGGQILLAATYDGDGNKVFQMSRKYVDGTKQTSKKKKVKTATIQEADDDSDEDGSDENAETKKAKVPTVKENFDPDIFWYGGAQGVMKLTAGQCPALLTAIGKEIRDLWHGFKTFVTGDYTQIDMGGNSAKTADGDSPDAGGDKLTANQMATIVVPGTERATLVTWDITNYLNDTNFNENAQVMYQYDQDGKEKASYTYGEADQRISGDLTKEAVKYTEQKAGDYSYLYDGQGNVTNTVRNGSVAEYYSYDPFGEMTTEGKEGTSKTPLEAKNDNGLSDNDVLWGYNGEEYIEEVGLQYLRQRHYSPETGTFTSQDTNEGDLTNPLSQNRYIYAENDPVNGNDPGGDKKKAKKTSTKKTNKKSAKSSSKSSKKTSKKTNKKTTSKKSPSKKKASSKKSSSKKSGSKWNKFKSYVKGRYTATKKGIKKGYRVLKDKATALKKSVTCKAKQAKSFAKKQIRNAKAQISKAKHTLKTKATNAITYVKNNPGKIAKSALKGMGKALSSIPGVKQISMALGATKAIQGLKEKLYAWADKIKTGFTPSASMKMQMEQNYTAYLQNNSSYKSSKEYQNAFKNKTLRDDLEIAESQINTVMALLGEGITASKGATSIKKSSNLKQLEKMLREGVKTSDNRNIIYQIDDKTKLIYRMDVGEYAHSMKKYGYNDPINHINLEIQAKGASGSYKPKWDYHIILDKNGKVKDAFATGVWEKKR